MADARKDRILVLDDDPGIITVLKTLLRRQGYEVFTLEHGEHVVRVVDEEDIDLVLTDLVMPGIDGMAVLSMLVNSHPNTPVVMMTGHADVDSAINAMRLGAFDYIGKPFDLEELLAVVRRALPFSNLGGTELSKAVEANMGMIGESLRMRQLYDLIAEAADMETTFCLLGESGVGKSLVARALHDCGVFRDGPFIEFDCLDIPSVMLHDEFFGVPFSARREPESQVQMERRRVPFVGCLEQAHGGTLYLNEIGCLPHSVQHDLVRVVQSGMFQRDRRTIPAEFRVLISSTEPLERKLARGELLEELYYGLGLATIELPPLRERAGDIALLTQHTMHDLNLNRDKKISIERKAMAALEAYPWPGNVRELVGSIRRAARRAATEDCRIRLEHLPRPVRYCFVRSSQGKGYSDEYDLRWRSLRKFLRQKEMEFVTHTLRAMDGDRNKAAHAMGISAEQFEEKYGEDL